jgi:cytochrome b involved in lipid metabolism
MGAGGNVLGEPTKKISLSEVRKHNKASDGWVVLYGKVYDVTSYINQHPGGRVLLSALGEADSTGASPALPAVAAAPPSE